MTVLRPLEGDRGSVAEWVMLLIFAAGVVTASAARIARNNITP